MYSVPVNVKDPGANLSAAITYGTALTKNGKVRLNMTLVADVLSNTSYQSNRARSGINTTDFDYSSFMREFWGSPEGDLFYSGASGFEKSRTSTYSLVAGSALRLNLDYFQMRVGVYPTFRSSKYSLDPKANLNTLDMEYSLDMSYQTKNDFEFQTTFNYETFHGYEDMFSKPMFPWNFSALKNIKAFTFGVELRDILNSNRLQGRVSSDNYSRYSFTNTLGRSVLLSLKLNFGKMNAAKSAAASDASLKMAL